MARPATLALTMLGTVALAAAAGSDAGASTVIAVPFEALVGSSTAVAFVTPVTQSSVWEADRIVTYTDVHVDTRVAGDEPMTDDVWVRTLGGEVGTIGQSVEGEAVLTVGRPSLLFLRSAATLGPAASRTTLPGVYAVTARAQGQFPVVTEAGGVLRVHRSSAVGATMASRAAGAPLASDTLHGTAVDDARRLVAAAWSRTHAP